MPRSGRLALLLVPAVIAILGIAGGPTASAAPTVTKPDPNPIASGSRAAVTSAYLQRWQPLLDTQITPTGGSVLGCRSFTTPKKQQRAIAAAINFARGLVGESGIRFTSSYDAAAARSALIMAANKQLSHDPPSGWDCWSKAGHDASGRSNILLSSDVPSAARVARLYLDDVGSSNIAAGHRRWVLRPEATTMGSGNAVGGWFGNALYVFTFHDDKANAPAKRFYAWPAAGWFPSQVEPQGRWSLSSSAGASFTHARVRVTGPGNHTVPVTVRRVENGYGDNTLVWDLKHSPAPVSGTSVASYTVRISGIRHSSASSYTYRVRLFDPTASAPTVAR